MNEGRGVRVEGERLSVKEKGSGGELDPDPDPWQILWILIWQNDADPLDPDPQHCWRVNFLGVSYCAESISPGIKLRRVNLKQISTVF